jgi:hypothetical protein
MMPLLTEICRTVLNSELDGQVVFNDLRSWGERFSEEAKSSANTVPLGPNPSTPGAKAPD